MQLRSGKEHSSGHGKAGLGQLLEEPGVRGPALVRGDSGYGNQDIIDICEKHNRRYLLRLRKAANVKRLIERLYTPCFMDQPRFACRDAVMGRRQDSGHAALRCTQANPPVATIPATRPLPSTNTHNPTQPPRITHREPSTSVWEHCGWDST